MRQKLGVEHLNRPITSQIINTALTNAESAIDDLSELPPTWLSFCNEKLQLASESLGFLLKQRVQFHKRGYPSHKLDYLKLIERQIEELKQVYLSFYRLAPGIVHQMKSEEPEIYVWLMLQQEFGGNLENLLCGLSVLDDIEPVMAMVFTVQSSIENFDRILTELIEGQSAQSSFYLNCLQLRQSVNTGLIRRWLKTDIISPQVGFPILAVRDVEEGIDWINENAHADEYLFERLITKRDRGTWFRQHFGIETESVSSPHVITFAKLLQLQEYMVFDIDAKMAPVHFALSGDWQHVPEIVEYIDQKDESDGEVWIQALYVVYGSLLPLEPKDVGVEYDWHEIVDLLRDWLDDERHILNVASRLGCALSFESTLEAMKDTDIDVTFRTWLWRQICIKSRIYVPWDTAMSAEQQQRIFNNLKRNPSLSDRFNLGSSNAVVGY